MDTEEVPRGQWSVSVHRTLLLSVTVIAAAAVGLCAFAALRKKRLHKQQQVDHVEAGTVSPEVGNLRVQAWDEAIKKVMWCWLDRNDHGSKVADQVADKGSVAATVSPLWQRRILMGERCELPHFSGLILYNEQGLPIRHNTSNRSDNLPTQEKPAVVLTTLRDLL